MIATEDRTHYKGGWILSPVAGLLLQGVGRKKTKQHQTNNSKSPPILLQLAKHVGVSFSSISFVGLSAISHCESPYTLNSIAENFRQEKSVLPSGKYIYYIFLLHVFCTV